MAACQAAKNREDLPNRQTIRVWLSVLSPLYTGDWRGFKLHQRQRILMNF